MPSGFQQDTNQLSPDFYRVVLTLSGGTGNYAAASPADGAINPTNWDGFTTLPSSDTNAERLARGNMRWQCIIEELNQFVDAQILDVEVTSADNTNANNVPTQIAFTVKYDRDDFLLSYDGNDIIGTADKVASISPTTGAALSIAVTNPTPTQRRQSLERTIRFFVARGITRNNYTRKYNVWVPASISGAIKDITINTPDILADVLDDVAVQLLDGTELVSTV